MRIGANESVANGRRRWPSWFLPVLALACVWPFLAYHGAGNITDTSSYYRGGREAVAFVVSRIGGDDRTAEAPAAQGSPARDGAPAPATNPALTTNSAKTSPAGTPVGGLRSIPYSVMTYLLAGPGVSLTLLIVFQALCVANIATIFARASGLSSSPRTCTALILLLALGTSAPIFVTLATPDIFAGVMIAAVVASVLLGERLRRVDQVVLALLTALSLSVHASHAALGIAVLGIAAVEVCFLYWRCRDWCAAIRWVWVVAGLLLGLGINMASGLVAFGEVSVAPKHFPFALARSIEDGPAYWYLKTECRQKRYALCEVYPDEMPQNNFQFLWGPNGIAARATPEQMDRIRAEEPEIVRAALRRYPGAQLSATGGNVWRQLTMVGIGPDAFHGMRLQPDGTPATVPLPGTSPLWMPVQIVVVLASFAVLIGAIISGRGRSMAVLLLILLLANAAICGGVSAPDWRYQNRVIWVLPLVAFAILWGWLRGRPASLSYAASRTAP
jgi:hypothetical protein